MNDAHAQTSLSPDGPAARRWTIGLLVGSAEDKYENALLRGISDVARPAGSSLICFTSGTLRSYHGFEAQRNVLYDLISAERVDGLIISGTLGHSVNPADLLEFCRHYAPLPLVSVAVSLPGIPSVMVDSRQSLRAIMRHLLDEHGYRRLAFLRGPRDQQEAEDRFTAYRQELAEHGLTFDPDLIMDGDFTYESGAAAMQRLLERPGNNCQAVVAANDSMALGALSVLQQRGWQVPDQLAVTGFDDTEDGRFSVPPLTTIRQSAYVQGRQAAQLLLDRLRGESEPASVIVPGTLIVRQSCGCLEQRVAQAVTPIILSTSTAPLDWAAQRAALCAALTQVASPLPGDLTSWPEQLFDAFSADLAADQPGRFLTTLRELVELSQQADDDGGVWHNVLSALRCHVLPQLSDAAQRAQAENLWQQARTLIGERARLWQARLHVQTEQRAAILREIGEALITSFTLTNMLDVIAWELPRLRVTACYLSLFEDPTDPTAARLILAYDAQGRQTLPPDGERFAARQLVPPARLRCAAPYNLVVEALYSKEERLGFVLFEVEPPLTTICGALRGQLSSALLGVMLLEQRRQAEAELKQHQNQLEELVKLRTRAVSDANAQLQQEIFERTQAEAALRQSEGILAVVARVARQLLETADWRQQIQTVLAQLGEASQASHAYVFENHLRADGELLMSQRYEWVMSGFQPEIDDPRLQNVVVHQSELDDWYGPLLRGDPFYSSSRGFSEHWSESLAQRGIKTLLDVPIFVDGEWWGLIGFDDYINELAWSEVQINALQAAAGILGAAIQRQRADEERETLIAQLEARNSELERFTYTVSHDLKSPLITVRGFLGFVEQDARNGNFDRMEADLARIVEATDKMRHLLDDLLELSRIGRLMNPPEAVPFDAIAQEAIKLVQGRIVARGVQVELAPGLPVVYGDRARLVEVVQNLIDNACKFMGDQRKPQITIGQRGADREGKPIVFVQDNGIGIDPRYHEKVFGLFDKLDAKGEGTGVGLALVKRIVEVYGGRIWVESEAGQGAIFLFTLPLAPDRAAA